MNRAQYLKTCERLRAGEAIQWTPQQAAAFVRAQTREQIREGMAAAGELPQPITPGDLDNILTRYGGNFGIWALFTSIVRVYRLTPAAFASGLAAAYTTGHADRKTALLCFNSARPADIMTPDELAALAAFPEPLTIYRGCGIDEHRAKAYGLSWTISRPNAEFFAWRYDTGDRSRVVLQTTVQRADILAYLNSREECEIITNVTSRRPVEVIASEPSPLYWEYMERRGFVKLNAKPGNGDDQHTAAPPDFGA